MQFNEIEDRTLKLAGRKGMRYSKHTTNTAMSVIHDIGEFHEAYKNDDKDDMFNAIGNAIGNLVVLADQQNIPLEPAFQHAFERLNSEEIR